MVQLELPLAYPEQKKTETKKKYRLPIKWQAVFVLLLIYSLTLSGIVFKDGRETKAEAPHTPKISVEAVTESAQVKMIARVNGWYKVSEVDNENLSVSTNMNVWVNGREFVRLKDGSQEFDPNLVEF